MENEAVETRSDAENALYLGAIVTAVISLLPYVNVFILPAYVIGAAFAVRHAARLGQLRGFKEGAKLGFLSTLLGSMVAVLLADLIWLFFDYQLWHQQNGQVVLAIAGRFAGPVTLDLMRSKMAEQAVKPFQWYMLLLQAAGNLVLCGIFGTLSGLITTKICRPSDSLGNVA